MIKIDYKLLLIAVFLMFIAYVLRPFVFEKSTFFNELFSLIGFLIFLKHTYSKGKFILPNSKFYLLVIFYICIASFQTILSMFRASELIFYLRQNSIMYSSFSFFIGYYLYPGFQSIFIKVRKILSTYLLTSVLFKLKIFISRFSGTLLFPFMFRRYSIFNLLLLVILCIIYDSNFESMTTIVFILVTITIFVIPNFRLFKVFVILSLIGILTLFTYFKPYLDNYKVGNQGGVGNLELVMQSHPLLGIDVNTTWRLLLWYRTIHDNFPMNIIGIGYGTPLFPGYIPKSGPKQKYYYYEAHTSGAHNSFITVFARLGIGFVIFFISIYYLIFKEFYNHKQIYKSTYFPFFISFIAITIIGFFNVVIESPVYSSMFWITLGFLTRIIDLRRESRLPGTFKNVVT